VNDTISEKPHSDKNDVVCWHYDHISGKVIKGINLMTTLYHVPSRELSPSVEFLLIAKTETYVNKNDGKTKHRSPITKSEYYLRMLKQAVTNQIRFKYEPNNVWFTSVKSAKIHSFIQDATTSVMNYGSIGFCLTCASL
jgi:hypothetical protein